MRLHRFVTAERHPQPKYEGVLPPAMRSRVDLCHPELIYSIRPGTVPEFHGSRGRTVFLGGQPPLRQRKGLPGNIRTRLIECPGQQRRPTGKTPLGSEASDCRLTFGAWFVTEPERSHYREPRYTNSKMSFTAKLDVRWLTPFRTPGFAELFR